MYPIEGNKKYYAYDEEKMFEGYSVSLRILQRAIRCSATFLADNFN